MKRIVFLAALALAAGSCSAPTEVVVEDVWSPPVPPVAPASAVFFEITNGLETTISLNGATSEACERLELHETNRDDADVVAMRPIAGGIELAPGESHRLVPGATHLMCIGPDVFEGSYDVTLNLTNAADVTVTVAIEQR